MNQRLAWPWALVALHLAGCRGCEPTTETAPGETAPPTDTTSTDRPPDDTGPTVEDLDPWIQPEVWLEPTDVAPGEQATVRYQGALASRDALHLLWGFDGGQPPQDPTGWLGGRDESSCPDYYQQVAMDPSADGGFEASITVPTEARTLDLWFEDPSDGSTDDADGLRYHHSFVFPYMGPWLGWSAPDTAHAVTIGFMTSVPCLGVVAWGEDEPHHLVAGQERGFRHHIALTGLEPGTSYRYRVHDCAGHASETYGFTTAPDQATSLSFLALADMQDNGDRREGWATVAAQAERAAPDAAFLLMPGDLTCNDTPGSWWRFFDRARPLMAQHLAVPAIGNHDTPTRPHDPDRSSFVDIFDLPASSGSETWATVDWGPARVILLDSEVLEELVEPGWPQHDWLEAELARSQSHPGWVFVALHEPLYNLGQRFWDDQGSYRPVSAGFDGVVDWVLTGHEHIFQRTLPLRYDALLAPSGQYGRGAEDGLGHMVLPTAGDETFQGAIVPDDEEHAADHALLAAPEVLATGHNLPAQIGFTVIALEGEHIELTTWGMGTLDAPAEATVVDRIDYVRSAQPEAPPPPGSIARE